MLPRIEAGERLAATTDRAIAAGNMQKFDAARIRRRLEEQRSGSRRALTKASPGVLKGMGIGVVSAPSAASKKALKDG